MAESSQRQAWLDKARKGDPLAIAGLLAAYYPVLRARAEGQMGSALKAKLEPEDVLQEVYLDVFRQIDGFEERTADSFLNWVLTILDSKLIDARRALHRRKRDINREMHPHAPGGTESYWNLLDQLHADSCTPSRVARHEEAVGALLACVSGLADSHRQVIQLRFLEGCSAAEAANRLGKSQATIVALTRAALEALRKSMDRLGEFTRG